MQLQNKGKKMENAPVLTSNEFLKELEEKEKLKAEKEAQKQLRKLQREEKRAQKAGTKKASEHGHESACARKDCPHPRARSWVKCSNCNEWYHCMYERASYSDVQNDDYVFVCKNC